MAVGNVTPDTGFTGGASRTISHNHDGNTILLGVGSYDTNTKITSVTWNGTAVNLLKTSYDGGGGENNIVHWYGLATSDAGTHDVVVSYSPNSPYGANYVVVSIIDAHASPFGETGGDFNNSDASPLSNTISMTAGSIAFDICSSSSTTPTVDSSQDELTNAALGGERVFASYKLDATEMVWTYSGSIRRAHAIIEVKTGAAPVRKWFFGGRT